MEFDSPDVEKEFPGLYASESSAGRKKDDDEFSEGDHDKISKRRKDKKIDRGYATLDGESSPDEDTEIKSPSKSKKSKAFKFATSKSKEKREKSRDKDRIDGKFSECTESTAGIISGSLTTLSKKKEKEKKEKDKKEKNKDKEKKEKKFKQSGASEEILELGDAQPIFGVSLGLAVERSRCHDNVNLPLVIRDCIDYLQEHGLFNDHIYKLDAGKARLQQLKRNYNYRESTGTEEWDVPTACGLLKLFFKELPEPILTTDLSMRFEEAAAIPLVTQQQHELQSLVQQLPSYNRTLLAWTVCHFDEVIQHEHSNKTNAQNLAVLLSPTLQMSHRLLVCILCHCSTLFEDTKLHRYIPPITATSPNLPETSDEITEELRKQDSLLNQIHAEMNAGFVTKKREEQLWEVQRIITQLKRKLRSFEKKADCAQRSIDDTVDGDVSSMDLTSMAAAPLKVPPTKSSCSDDESLKTATVLSTESTNNTETKTSPQATPENVSESVALPDEQQPQSLNPDQMYVHESGILMVPATHPDCIALLRLQLENMELAQWKSRLQTRINGERSDILRLKELLKPQHDGPNTRTNNDNNCTIVDDVVVVPDDTNYERIVAHYLKENALLEQKKNLLLREVFQENIELIQLQVDLAVQTFSTRISQDV